MPSGAAPPEEAGGLELRPLADAVVERYAPGVPRRGRALRAEVWRAWCRHDTQYLMQWAVLDTKGLTKLAEQVAWLARVLAARDFPLEASAHARAGADVVAEGGARRPAERLRAATAAGREPVS
jgi:hypothetical protein